MTPAQMKTRSIKAIQGAKVSWERAQIIASLRNLPLATARSIYSRMPKTLRNEDEFWMKLKAIRTIPRSNWNVSQSGVAERLETICNGINRSLHTRTSTQPKSQTVNSASQQTSNRQAELVVQNAMPNLIDGGIVAEPIELAKELSYEDNVNLFRIIIMRIGLIRARAVIEEMTVRNSI